METPLYPYELKCQSKHRSLF